MLIQVQVLMLIQMWIHQLNSTSNNTSTSNVTSSNTNVNTNTNVNVNTSNNTNNSTSNNTNTNTNTSNSTSDNTNTNSNTNVNTSTSDSKVQTDNKNVNENTSTSDNTNRNINESKSEQVITQNINQKAPPASAIAPSIMSYSQDLCTTGRSGAFQGQVFGFSAGRTIRDMNCERLKLGKYLYDMGMKVASVALMCQDDRVFKAMEMAGTPCPYMGETGKRATAAWKGNPQKRPDAKEKKSEFMAICRSERTDVGRKSRNTCKKEWKNSWKRN